MNETLAELYRQVGLQPAWQRQPEAQPGYTPPRPRPRSMRPAIARLYDPNQGVRDQAAAQVRRERELAANVPRALGGASGFPDRDQIAETGMNYMEMTGAPSLARGVDWVSRGEPGEAIPELLMGGLGALGMATLPYGGGAYAAATRQPMGITPHMAQVAPEPMPPIRPPARLPGRAADGSVLPIRPSEPFRNSMRGGSDDLMDAARAPDGGAAGGETWYRGTAADKPLEPGLGGAIWLSDNADVANRYSADAYLRTRQRGQVYDFPQVQPRNPLEIDMRGEPIMALYGRLRRDLGVEGEYADVLRQVRERGHDAIVIRNVRDQYTPGGRGGPQTQLAVLDPAILGEPHVFGRPWRAPDAPNAARAPDGGASGGGNAYREQLRAEGFDVDRPLFHGTTADFDEFSTATLRDERGIHLADDHETANFFAGMGQNGRVVPVYVRGRLREHVGPTGSAVDGTIRLAREAGDAGVIVTYPGTARTGFRPRREIIVFDPANIRPQIGRAPDAPNAGPSRPPPRPKPPPRRPNQ